jgi:hypothetical protein
MAVSSIHVNVIQCHKATCLQNRRWVACRPTLVGKAQAKGMVSVYPRSDVIAGTKRPCEPTGVIPACLMPFDRDLFVDEKGFPPAVGNASAELARSPARKHSPAAASPGPRLSTKRGR